MLLQLYKREQLTRGCREEFCWKLKREKGKRASLVPHAKFVSRSTSPLFVVSSTRVHSLRRQRVARISPSFPQHHSDLARPLSYRKARQTTPLGAHSPQLGSDALGSLLCRDSRDTHERRPGNTRLDGIRRKEGGNSDYRGGEFKL